MARFYISDLHFFHEYIMDYDHRLFQNASEMNDYMIEKWNGKVHNSDEVIILGVFSFGTPTETMYVLKILNGRKCLVIGNHDKYISHQGLDKKLFGWIEPYKELYERGKKVICSHFPIHFYNDQFLLDASG